jgi:1-phosphofructokinase
MQRFDAVTVTLNPAIDRTVTIANFAAGQVNRVEEMRQNAGGKGVNVAAVLADAGHVLAATGFLGRENSALFEALFAQKQIADHFVRIDGQTRVGIKIADPVLRQTTDINFPGQAPTPADVAALRRVVGELDGGWFVLAGSLPPGMQPTIYAELVAIARSRGHRVALDTSGPALQHAIEAGPEIIKPNIHELEEMVGATLPDQSAVVGAARALIARGVGLVVVSMGADGACFVSRDQVVMARPPAVEVASTVGAGDAMVAGVVAAQLRGLALAEAARLATAFSLDAIQRIGAGLSAPDTIAALMERVSVEA